MNEYISIKGACEHNLKNISVKIPPGQAGRPDRPFRERKILPAFDTIYAEGQQRYVESPPPMPDSFWPDGKAGCGLYRRAFPCHLHRPEDHQPQHPAPPWAR